MFSSAGRRNKRTKTPVETDNSQTNGMAANESRRMGRATILATLFDAARAILFGTSSPTTIERIVEAIIRDEKTILTVSTLLNDYYGVNDAYLSVPTILGRNGVEKVLNINLSQDEEEKFVSSANLMKEYIDRINDK